MLSKATYTGGVLSIVLKKAYRDAEPESETIKAFAGKCKYKTNICEMAIDLPMYWDNLDKPKGSVEETKKQPKK